MKIQSDDIYHTAINRISKSYNFFDGNITDVIIRFLDNEEEVDLFIITPTADLDKIIYAEEDADCGILLHTHNELIIKINSNPNAMHYFGDRINGLMAICLVYVGDFMNMEKSLELDEKIGSFYDWE